MLSLRETVFRRLRLQKKARRQKQALRRIDQQVSVESLEVRSLLTVTVFGTSDPWLAGMPNGSTASGGSVAPTYSPVQADVTVIGGQAYTFAATGSANHGGGATNSSGPDGRPGVLFSHQAGAENGIANITVQINALLGVFLSDSLPNTTGAPTALNFSTSASMDFLTLSPALKQPFFIGNGLTSSGVTQQFVAPAGATRLFLGAMDSFGYSNNSGSYAVSSAQFIPNTPPVVVANAASVSVNEGGTVSNTGTFSDSQGNASVTITANVGTVTQNNVAGTWSWSLNAADGPTSGNVTITARDNQNAAATATFAYSANNIAPTISLNGNATVNEGSPYTLNLGVVTDPGQDTIQSYIINWGDGTTSGVLTGNPANTTATHIFADGPATQTNNVTVTDEDGNFLAGSLSVQVLNVAPSVTNTGDVSVNEGSTAANTGSWSDPGQDTVTLSASVGSVTQSADGTWSWSLSTNDGPDQSQTVTITATDSDGAETATTFALTVNNVAPSVTGGTFTVEENRANGTVVGSVSASDPGVDTISFSITAGNTGGAFAINSSTGQITVANSATLDFETTSVFNLTVAATDSDNAVGTASMTINVGDVNEAPVNTVPGAQTVWVGQTIVFSTANGNAISVNDDSGPNGMLQMTLTATTGTLTLASTSGLTFATGDGTADTTMKFSGTRTNIVAALNGLVYTSTTGGVGTLTVTTDDLGSSGSNPNGDAAGRIDNGGFEMPFVANGSFRLFPAASVPPWSTTDSLNQIEIWGTGFQGVPAFEGRQFAEINANSAGTLSTTVQPTAGRAIEFAFAHRGRQLSNEQVRVTVTDLGADGVLGGGNDSVLLNKVYTDGTSAWGSYQENLGFATGNKLLLQFAAVNPPGSIGNFLDGIRFGVTTLSDTDTVTINNLAPPTVPTDAVAPTGGTITEGLANGSAVGITARSTDPNGDPITYSLTNNAGGRFAINPTTGVVTVANSTLLDGPGSHIITVQASDGTDPVRGISSANFTITVTNVNPTATLSNGGPVNEGSTGTVSFSNPFDPSTADSAFRYAFDFDNNGTFDSGNGTYAGSGSSVSATVPASFLTDGNSTRTVRGRIIDKDGGFTDYTTAISVLNVAPTFEAGADETVQPPQLGAFSRSGIGITDPGNPETFGGTVNFGDGTVTQTLTINQATRQFNLSHTFPNTNSAPAIATYHVTVTVNDGDGGSHTDSFDVTVNLNTPPVAEDDSVATDEDHSFTLNVLANDHDNQNNIVPSLTTNLTSPAAGVLTNNHDGTFSFNPNGAFESLAVGESATVSFDYQVVDAFGETDTGTVTITITGVNDGPSVSVGSTSVTVNEGQTASNSGSWSDIDTSDVVALTASVGTVTKNADGTWSWSFHTNDGPDESLTVTITATDSHGASTTSRFNLTVNNVAPDAVNDSYSTPQAILLTGNVITGGGADTDPAGANDPLTVAAVNGVASHVGQAIALSNGTLTVNANGSFSYQPDTTFVGTESFTYTTSDGDGGFDTATVTVVVNAAAGGSILTVVDTCCDGGTALLITGTSANDHIVVAPGSTSATLHVNVNGVISTVAKPSGRIIVLGLAGNDNIQIAGAISNSVWLYGDEGDDRLNAGNVSPGGNLLFGGDGNDDLLGGNGRDILIGGQGADKITANADDDILIAGLTTHDTRNSAAHEEFWCNVLHEWTELDPFATRVNRLRTGSGHTGANLLASVVDDNSADQIDQLQGSAGNDWFLFKSGEDKLTGQTEATN